PGLTVVNPGTPSERRVHSKASDTVQAGDVVSFQQSGAGGYGPPWERDPRAVLRDVLEDYVSIEGARRDYGVVIDGAAMTVEAAATPRARGAMRDSVFCIAAAPVTVDEAATARRRPAMRRDDPGPPVSRLGPLW